MGLMIGMELAVDGKEIVSRCLRKGVIINCTLDTVLRFLPPLNVKKADIDRCVAVLDGILRKL
jgi:acetylornithine/succinyldiaminopimelate/putrescine aminotransferase